ncbi:hypothetical protein QEN19_002544 [Hanseniaspora menglaensis]
MRGSFLFSVLAFLLCLFSYFDFSSAVANLVTNVENLRSSSNFEESLELKILPTDYLLSSFNFKLQSDAFDFNSSRNLIIDSFSYRNHNGFSKKIEPLLNSANVKNLFLKFARGHWDYSKWGKTPKNGWSSAGSGVEIWALIEANNKSDAIDNWGILVSQLSGMFCSSVNFINAEKITFPHNVSSYMDGKINVKALPKLQDGNSYFLLRGSLANEPICTENLSPILRFLPTNGKVGLSSLLDGHKIFDSYWSYMSIDLSTICDDFSMCHYDMEIDIHFVVNIQKSLARNRRPSPRATPVEELQCDTSKKFTEWECFPLPTKKEYSFLISDIFGSTINDRSRLNLVRNSKIKVLGIDNEYWNTAVKIGEEMFATDNHEYELNEQQPCQYDIYIFTNDNSKLDTRLIESNKPPLYVSRTLTGNSQDKGGIRVIFTNPSKTQDAIIKYYETLPWFMRVYVSSLKISSSDISLSNEDLESLINDKYVSLSDIRGKPLHLEYTITVPKSSTLTIHFDVEKPLLNYEEYPPDSNHGFEIESALVVVLDRFYPNKNYFIRTPTLLLSLATPDFSMPYNVITITSTLMAFCFGLIFNLLTKRIVSVEDSKHLITEKPLIRIVKKIKKKFKS